MLQHGRENDKVIELKKRIKILENLIENIADGADDLAVFLSDYDTAEDAIISIGASCRRILPDSE